MTDVARPVSRPAAAPAGRGLWLGGTVALTVASFALAIALAPDAGAKRGPALAWLLFLGSGVHVAATGWLYTVPEIREHVREHRGRYVLAPAALVAGTAAVALVLDEETFVWLLLPFFGWQFWHFQKQNLGMAALAAISHDAGSLRREERWAILVAGVAGTAGLLVRPALLQLDVDPGLSLLFPVAALVFAGAVSGGLLVLRRRPPGRRPAAFVGVYAGSLLFFAPVFLFDSPYAAVAGLVLAHGYQYLLILALVLRGSPGPRLVPAALLVNVALLGGLALTVAAELHAHTGAVRLLFGAYVGVTMAHFVVDAGIWRLRDEFPRRFMTERLPYLLDRPRG